MSGLAMGAALHMAEAQERAEEKDNMTEQQFSKEYIDYMQSDEAKVLQALWVPASYSVGDYVLVDSRLGVVAALDTRDHFADEGVRYFAITFDCPNTRALGDPEWEVWERHSLTWLPTLFQLIRVIEGAGFRWYRRTNETWGIHREGDADRWEVNAYGDDLLAAAQLAVRAIEVEK